MKDLYESVKTVFYSLDCKHCMVNAHKGEIFQPLCNMYVTWECVICAMCCGCCTPTCTHNMHMYTQHVMCTKSPWGWPSHEWVNYRIAQCQRNVRVTSTHSTYCILTDYCFQSFLQTHTSWSLTLVRHVYTQCWVQTLLLWLLPKDT